MATFLPFFMDWALRTSEKVPSPFLATKRYSAIHNNDIRSCQLSEGGRRLTYAPGGGVKAQTLARKPGRVTYCAFPDRRKAVPGAVGVSKTRLSILLSVGYRG